jgi:TonB family protein
MKMQFPLGLTIVLLGNSFVFAAQNKQSVPSDEAAPVSVNDTLDAEKHSDGRRSAESSVDGGNLDVLSDTMGVNFMPYLQRVLHDVRFHWYNLMPAVARTPIMKKGRVKIEFAILKDGHIENLQRVATSGDVFLDRAAWGGIAASSPFPPLPSEFRGQYLALRMTFLYNPSLSGLTPSVIQINTGSSQQFSPILQRVSDPALFHISWSVKGFDCTGDSCGTVSATGLYTAPASVASPTNVTVIAKADDDLGEQASATITIVQPKSPR